MLALSCVAVDGSTMRSSPLRELHLKGTHIIIVFRLPVPGVLVEYLYQWSMAIDQASMIGNEDDVMQGSVDVQKQGQAGQAASLLIGINDKTRRPSVSVPDVW